MTKNEFLAAFRAKAEQLADTVERKNNDYAGTEADDAFHNFRIIEFLTQGRITAADGLIVRMTDKLVRAFNLSHQDAAVAGESQSDTADDLAAYALILSLLQRPAVEVVNCDLYGNGDLGFVPVDAQNGSLDVLDNGPLATIPEPVPLAATEPYWQRVVELLHRTGSA